MIALENIQNTYPDKFGIKEKLRNFEIHNPEFFELTLSAYKIFAFLKNQKLSITDSLRNNNNVSIFDHQILAAQKVKNEFGGTALLADEVGLGKTVEAGIIIKEFLVTGLAKKILILAPPSLLPQWQGELFSKFDLDFVSQQEDSRFVDVASHDLLIMSHSSAIYPSYSDKLQTIYWDLVVVDEAHSMKNSKTYKHMFVKNLLKRNLLLLTATPIQNNLEELYNIVELLRPGYLGTWKKFQERYTLGMNARRINPIFRSELQNILSKLVIRTTRKEVRNYIKFTDRIPHTDIIEPDKNEVKLYREITSVVRRLYSMNYSAFGLMIYQRLASSSTNASKKALYKMKANKIITEEQYACLYALANEITLDSKITNLIELIKNDSNKFLVFTEFYATQDYIAKILKEHGYSVTLFNGKLSLEEKYDSVKRFKNESQIMVATSAGGEGQNFQFCHNIVNYDLPWNPMRVEQRIGRVHRIGQNSDVQIFNFALKGTIESYILQLLYTKIELFNMALGELDLLFEDTTEGELQQKWFKEYMMNTNEEEIQNRFSALGNDWKKQRDGVVYAIKNFNDEVFKNFDLSTFDRDEINDTSK